MVFCFFPFYFKMNKLLEKQKVPTFKSTKAFSNNFIMFFGASNSQAFSI